MAGLEQSIARRKGVVEDGVIGEVAHCKVVDLRNRAGMSLARRIHSLDLQLPRKHAIRLTDADRAPNADSGSEIRDSRDLSS